MTPQNYEDITILGVKEMNEQERRRLDGYDLKSITRADDCDCYDVVLTPRPLPEVRVRIREVDLIRLAIAETANKDGVWELDIDCGTLFEVLGDSKLIPRLKHLVSAEIDGEAAHFYGYYKEQ